MSTKYKKYWIGRCIDEGLSINLEVGQLYLLRDIKGDKTHFNVSRFVSNSDAFMGSYRGILFEVLEDVTEAILAMPFEKGVMKYEIHVGVVKMVARQRGISYIEAQQQLINERIIYQPVLDSKGEPLRQHTEIGKPGTIRRPDFDYTPMPAPEPDVPNRTNPKIMPPASAEDYGDTSHYVKIGEESVRDTTEKVDKEKTTPNVPKTDKTRDKPNKTVKEKPKFVQKGLFG